MKVGLPLLAVLLGAVPALAQDSDGWQVRRDPTQARRQQAVRALLAAPEDPTLAARLVRSLPPAERARLAAALAERSATGGSDSGAYAAYMASGHLALALGKPNEAADSFGKAAALAPRPAAWHGQARALARAGLADRALAAYERAAGAGAARQVLEEAAALAATVAPAREVPLRRRVLEQAPSARAALALARALAAAGDPAGGAEVLERFRPGRDRLGLLEEAARLRESAGQDEAAEADLLACLDLAAADGGKARALARRLATLALGAGRGEEMVGTLTARLAQAPAAARAARWRALGPPLAELQEALGELDEALATWRRLGDSPASQAAVLTLLEKLDRQEELGPRFDRLARAGAQALDLLVPMVERAYERGDFTRARDRFDRLLRAGRRSRVVLVRLADVASRFEDHDRVLASWDALRALDPRDEQAVLGLGEAHFQRGRRELAHRTWGALLRIVRPPAAAHARLAEILADHDMLDEALAAAQAARRLAPRDPESHRTLARVLEKRREPTAAITAWRAALQASAEADQESARREARGRILTLLAREGRDRLRAETVLLKDRARRHPEDRETALFLADLQLRLQEPAAAVETLAATAERLPQDAEVVLMLVRLLRQSRQTEKALAWLSRLAKELPARAPEALLQVAALRLDRYEDEAAFEAVRRAVTLAGRSPDVALRAAEMAERAGRTEEARGFLAGAARTAPGSPRVALAASRLEGRQGEHDRALELLARAAEAGGDGAGRADLLAETVRLAEARGEATAALVHFPGADPGSLQGPPLSEQERLLLIGQARRNHGRRGAATGLERDERRLANLAVRAIGQRTEESGRPPELTDVELIGKLGNRDAVPRVLRLVQPGRSGGDARVPVAAIIALGRLADPRARPTLETLAAAPNPRVREAATWALARLGDRRSQPVLERAAGDVRPEVRAWALLGLGRLPDSPLTLVRQAALDSAAPPDVRRAALVAATRARAHQLAGELVPLISASDRGVALCASRALSALAGGESLVPLWRRALLGDTSTRRQAEAILLAIGNPPPPPVDETRFIEGSELRIEQVLDGLCESPPPPPPAEQARARGQLWVEHAQEIAELLGQAASGAGAWRALEALGSMPELPAEARQRFLELLGKPLGQRLVDPDWGLRTLALRAAARLQDPRLAADHVIGVVSGVGPSLPERRQAAEAAAVAALRLMRAQGRLDPAALAGGLGPLLERPDWQTRLTAARTLAAVGALSGDLRARVGRDANPFVRAVAIQPPATQGN